MIANRRPAQTRPVTATQLPRVAGAIAALSALLLDQMSKALIFERIGPGEEQILGPLLSISPGWNEGTAFGLAQGVAPWLLVAVALAITIFLAALIFRSRSPVEGAALGAVIGGALANVIDRIRFGAVRDFIDAHWNSLHWPTFNVADMCVVSGLLLFVAVDYFRHRTVPGV